MPHAHTPRAARWRFVTLSSRLHGCRHLAGRNLYRRVLGVAAREHQGKGEVVTLATKELSSLAEILPQYSFSFALVLATGGASKRRLQSSAMSAPELEALEELSSETGPSGHLCKAPIDQSAPCKGAHWSVGALQGAHWSVGALQGAH